MKISCNNNLILHFTSTNWVSCFMLCYGNFTQDSKKADQPISSPQQEWEWMDDGREEMLAPLLLDAGE